MTEAKSTPTDLPTISNGRSLPVGEIFDLLSNNRRRYALHYLKQHEGTSVTLRELSAQIAAWENGTATEAVTSKQRLRVYTALRQSHLPRMDRWGVVEFDSARGTVELTGVASQLDVYLKVVPSGGIPPNSYYASVGVASCALVLLVWADVFPFSLLSGLACAAVVAVSVLASALIHAHRTRTARLGREGKPPV